jgi:hypothetical protein
MNGWAQIVPNGINYQAIARNQSGQELSNSQLEVRFSILSGSANGNLEWEELHNVSTNGFGLFTLIIGEGSRTGGSCTNFNQINWGTALHFLKVEVKFDNTFIPMGTTQMSWVPYALYALKSGSGGGDITYDAVTHKLYVNAVEVADLSGLKEDMSNTVQNLSLDGNNLVFVKNGQNYQVDLSKFMDNTDSQNLSINGQVLSIANANAVTLPVQVLSVEQNTLKLSNGGGSVLFDSNPENELQFLRLNADTIEIYRPGYPKADGKIQLPDLFEERDTFYMKGYPKPKKISLRNELSKPKNNYLSINRGNTIYLDTDTTNEIQQLSMNESAKTLSLSGANTLDASNLINVPWVCYSVSSSNFYFNSGQERIVQWSEEDCDNTNSFSSTTFTVPSKGDYSLSMDLALQGSIYDITLLKNSTTLKLLTSFMNTTLSVSYILNLNAGDVISLKIKNNGGSGANLIYGTLSGQRLH